MTVFLPELLRESRETAFTLQTFLTSALISAHMVSLLEDQTSTTRHPSQSDTLMVIGVLTRVVVTRHRLLHAASVSLNVLCTLYFRIFTKLWPVNITSDRHATTNTKIVRKNSNMNTNLIIQLEKIMQEVENHNCTYPKLHEQLRRKRSVTNNNVKRNHGKLSAKVGRDSQTTTLEVDL